MAPPNTEAVDVAVDAPNKLDAVDMVDVVDGLPNKFVEADVAAGEPNRFDELCMDVPNAFAVFRENGFDAFACELPNKLA